MVIDSRGTGSTGSVSTTTSSSIAQESSVLSNGSVSSNTMNIYSKPPFLTVHHAVSAPSASFLQNGAVLPSARDYVDLTTSKEYHIDELQECFDIRDVKSRCEDAANDDNTMLIFDLTTSGCLISSSDSNNTVRSTHTDSGEASSKDIYRVHLSLPSTLVKRPKYHFEKLLQSVIDDSKRLKLMSLIDNCGTFLFYDGCSRMNHCLVSTYWLVKKFHYFLYNELCKKNVKLYILEKMERSGCDFENASLTDPVDALPNTIQAHGEYRKPQGQSGQKKLNLTIKMLPKATDKMFIQSIKKDTIHYSPNSLKKFFSLHIPDELEENDPILPKWLRPFSKREVSDKILQKLLENFEFLESLELKRLERGLTTNDNIQGARKIQDSNLYHKIYSLANLQKEFRGKTSSNNVKSKSSSSSRSEANLKITIPNPQLNLGNGNTNTSSPPNSSLSSHLDSDTESLLTPMGNYAMSHGIQSFSKNRYSNILPYEHSRVKLQPSPIHAPHSTLDPSLALGQADTTGPPSENGLQRKRRNSNSSYFNQKLCDTYSQRDNEGQDNAETASKENFNDYFNANYLNLPQINSELNYIATQAPLPSTIDDFWKVISANKVKIIISLNSNDELFLRKWDIYWNNDRSEQKYQIDITETFENCCNVEGCVLRIFSFYKTNRGKSDSEKLTVYQLQYTKWLDSCGVVMQDILSLYTIKNMLLNNPSMILSDLRAGKAKEATMYAEDAWPEKAGSTKDLQKQPPLLVHCSAGCGRTGVYITLDFLMNVLMSPAKSSNRIDVWNMSEDLIFIIVNELRKQRISMVQNLTQYITCYESILQYFALEKHKGTGKSEV
ncbi:hypothetical protein HG537_0F02470 [Torulaspora globosa]|uniref:Phosphatases II n=1 Tax=Torulaspora globosa TaxID=48254 RepID=A0A7H9HXA1_9SACH|nr:hypothetical protein HG537_0F02470 [Torulaspora sp. CBS 2947]